MTKFDVWMRHTARAVCGVVLTAAVVACGGGGGNAGTPVLGPNNGASAPSGAASAVAADLIVVLSKSTMTNSGTDSITATVTSVDENRATVSGVPVTFTVDANAVVTPAGTATDASGTLKATITQGSDTGVRPVTLTVKSGSLSRPVTFNVVQNPSTSTSEAKDLTLTLSATTIGNTGSRTVTATATAVDENRNALGGIPILLSVSDASAFIASSSNQTDASGQVTGTVNIGQDRSNRTITVVARSGTLSRTAAFQVTGARFAQASAVPAVVAAGAAGAVQYKLVDENSNAMVDVPISVTGAGVTSASSKTDLNGAYEFKYVAPNAPGTSLVINAVAGGVETSVTVPIPTGTGGTGVGPAVTPVAKTLNLSADVLAVNSATTNNQVAINAFFRDGANAPIPNVRVLFGVTGDNQTGKIASGTNTVLSDASGTASTSYTSGAVSSPTNGVTILACWKTTDFIPSDSAAKCADAGGQLLTTTLTIVSNPVSISIGTNNVIDEGAGGLTYIKKYVVLVVDSAGNPKSDVQITPSLDLGGYLKGYYEYNIILGLWQRSRPEIPGGLGERTATCPNEDLNRNGVIDSGEDINSNKQLDPRKSDVAITLVGATKTDANGIATLQLEYPKNVASWVKFKITVTAAGVLSPPAYYPLGVPVSLPSKYFVSDLHASEAEVIDYLATYAPLPGADAALRAEVDPPFRSSPYGTSGSCINSK
ncbi:MAG: hypothetical protein EOP38_10090 [Rubrivivax sp.]|nr:MAG: hypothetical protein EOP38_10090 [Rubrivivax sp.]